VSCEWAEPQCNLGIIDVDMTARFTVLIEPRIAAQATCLIALTAVLRTLLGT
jgi:hypothetical protein